MGRKKRKQKREVDELLLDAIFSIEHEWKQIKSLIGRSIEPTFEGSSTEKLAQSKYLFLLREARHRKISAVRYSK
ncbi:YaaL family protein [Ornithinibacillus californiensis]|uniref:YaaL family protein n=1 Tax=Ornithinibacillus californiensis TaxID=161536 RepID=UPI00064DFBD6|nr:YaaL family protein [Ornithinibacillus californiensis]